MPAITERRIHRECIRPAVRRSFVMTNHYPGRTVRVRSSNTGTLKTTVKAVQDGYWRWSFAGTISTPAVNSTGDFVDVK